MNAGEDPVKAADAILNHMEESERNWAYKMLELALFEGSFRKP